MMKIRESNMSTKRNASELKSGTSTNRYQRKTYTMKAMNRRSKSKANASTSLWKRALSIGVLLQILVNCGLSSATIRNVSLQVDPPSVRRGQHATFICTYDLQGAPLYSVKFYRGVFEFYRYSPSELPTGRIFQYIGFNVDLSMSNASQVVLRNVGFGLSGNFSCEVTADAPSFSTRTAHIQMQVVETMICRRLISRFDIGQRHVRQFTTSLVNHFGRNEFLQNADIHNNDETSNANSVDDFIETTKAQRTILSIGSSLAALVNPHRNDMIACLGETTGDDALTNLLCVMKSSAEGNQILAEQPRINSSTIDLNALEKLAPNTFGYAYKKFLNDNNVTPDSRMAVKFISDPELKYVMTRYRECHDLIHTVLGMPTHMLGEVTIKWIEAINIGLPMCYGGAIFGAMRLRPKQRQQYRQHYLPWALSTTKHMKPLISVYWEKRWEQDIEELRQELNIETITFDRIVK